MLIGLFVSIGLLLLYAEFFYSGWILGVFGVLCLLVTPFFTGCYNPILLSLEILLSCLVCWLAIYQIKKRKSKNDFFLDKDQEGFNVASFDPSYIGKYGVSLCDLKPGGYIEVGGKRLAVHAKEFITKGSVVRVVNGRAGYYLVEKGD